MTTKRRTDDGLAYWQANRDRLLELAGPGRRPAQWWSFEAPVERPHRRYGRLAEAVVLASIGQLAPAELDWLRRLTERDSGLADDARHVLEVAAGRAEPVLADRGLR